MTTNKNFPQFYLTTPTPIDATHFFSLHIKSFSIFIQTHLLVLWLFTRNAMIKIDSTNLTSYLTSHAVSQFSRSEMHGFWLYPHICTYNWGVFPLFTRGHYPGFPEFYRTHIIHLTNPTSTNLLSYTNFYWPTILFWFLLTLNLALTLETVSLRHLLLQPGFLLDGGVLWASGPIKPHSHHPQS